MAGSKKPKVLCVAGARPNFVKIAPLVQELTRREIRHSLVHTGQHYDTSMSAVFFEDLGIPVATHNLEIGSGTHAIQTARIMLAFEPVLDQEKPDVVVVVGDVNSTLACALVAAKKQVKVAHVEAGLRSFDWTMPEEINRRVTDVLSDLLLAPSEDAVTNLVAEGIEPSKIEFVGNVMADSLVTNVGRSHTRPLLDDLGLRPFQYAVVTLHRPALVDNPARLMKMLESLEQVGELLPLVWPVHPRVRNEIPYVPKNVLLTEPLGYLDFLCLESQAKLVITDSGGVQEETTILGVPCLTARDSTERPITVSSGTNRVIGSQPENLLQEVQVVLSQPRHTQVPALWDGRTAPRIVDSLVARFPGE